MWCHDLTRSDREISSFTGRRSPDGLGQPSHLRAFGLVRRSECRLCGASDRHLRIRGGLPRSGRWLSLLIASLHDDASTKPQWSSDPSNQLELRAGRTREAAVAGRLARTFIRPVASKSHRSRFVVGAAESLPSAIARIAFLRQIPMNAPENSRPKRFVG